MDLSLQVSNTTLNIRVAVLAKTPKGYIFEQSKSGYLFALGGRVKINETSLDAAKREVLEEIGYKVKEATFLTVIENFFDAAEERVHEICFVYILPEDIAAPIPENFVELAEDELETRDVRPEILKRIIIESKDGAPHHLFGNTFSK
jgi:8-oxo-dGTP pyrophosphatase MutT (NUDIX family)